MTTEAGTTSSELDLLHGALPAALARDDFANLAVLLRYAADGCFAIAVYNSAAREQVVSTLRQLVAPLPAFEWTYSPHDPYPFSYLDRLTDAQRRERAVVFFFGLDKADAAVLKSLDYNRERLARQPHGLVFWVTPAFLGEMARGAPHFWSQRSGVFDFTVAHPELLAKVCKAAKDCGAPDEADVAQAVRLAPEHPYTRGRQGWLALARGRFADAAQHLKAAAKANDAADWQYGLALAQLAAGDADQARSTLSSALPNMSEDDKAHARLWLDRVARLKPDLASAAEALRAMLR
ncbi:MAG: hypothetical protein KatS3mg052_1119 [Candidatus Roseilinea sp.]|nr:MAG: hypothetical protein KatS3mg052_1119 [Candidatus Roseilinea sp.]